MSETQTGALILLPNMLDVSARCDNQLPPAVKDTVLGLQGLISESETGGRRFLSLFMSREAARALPLAVYNKKTPDGDLDFFLEPVAAGQRWGFVSDCGMPCLADPGAKLVLRARCRGLPVEALPGPSSFVMAMVLSGLPCQRFAFMGYLPKGGKERQQAIAAMEQLSRREAMTVLCMEAPFRNNALLGELLQRLSGDSLLSLACDIGLPGQQVHTMAVSQWRRRPVPLAVDGRPAVFALYAASTAPYSG